MRGLRCCRRRELARRAGFGGGAFAAALLAFALATYTVRIRFDRRGGPSAAAVVSEHSALGVVWVTRRVLLGDGLRVLYVQETHEDAESSNTMIRAYLTTRRGALHPLTGVGDEQDPSRELLDALGASIANTSLVEAVLSEPLPNEQPDVHPAHDPNYEEPPLTGPEPAPALRSHAAGVALWVGAFALLCGLGSAAFDLLALSHAKGWVQTTYYFTNEDKGKYHNLVARTQLDSSVNLNPRPAAGKAYSSNVCWVLDHPRGHDIARYTPPSGPPMLRDEIRYSTLAMLGICMLFAFAAAGPWLRARRSFLVYAG